MYVLSTQRLGLRIWEEEDTLPFIEMNKDPEVMKYFPSIMTDEGSRVMIERMSRFMNEHNYGLFAVEEKSTNTFIGFTGFAIPSFTSFFTPCIEVGWRYKKEAWGKGFATEAARPCLQFGFEQLKMEKIVSFTSALNINSEKVMKRAGMQFVANFDHPLIAKNNPLRPHVLYEINRP